ncbi:MAG: hypothetical protein AAFQ82_05845 [Myxococcota bacterium]
MSEETDKLRARVKELQDLLFQASQVLLAHGNAPLGDACRSAALESPPSTTPGGDSDG